VGWWRIKSVGQLGGVMKKYNHKKRIVDEHLVKLADDLVLSILNAYWQHKGKNNLNGPTPHMQEAIYNFSDYRKELLG
jgi:hypothetical protein